MTSLVVHVCFHFNDLNQMQKRKVSRIVASLAVSNCYKGVKLAETRSIITRMAAGVV